MTARLPCSNSSAVFARAERPDFQGDRRGDPVRCARVMSRSKTPACETCGRHVSRNPGACNRPWDDAIVVVMSVAPTGRRLTLEEYLAGAETNRFCELTWGAVREPPSPSWDHQFLVGRLFVRLDTHVTRLRLGKVAVAPVDVILDPA